MSPNSNETSLVCSYSNDYVIPATIIFGFTVFLVMFENILICVAIMSSPLRQITSNLFLVGLAVADMFTSLTLIPLQLLEVWSSPHWPLGPIGVNIYNSLWNLCLVVPFLTVLTITIDRYVVITRKPGEPETLFSYQEVTVKWVVIVLVLVWTYSIILVSLLSLSFEDPPDNEYVWNVPYEYYYPFLAIHVLLPLLVICYCYLRILSTVRASKRQMLQIEDSRENHQRNEVKLAKTVGYVILALVVVWMPVLGMEVVYALDSGKSCIVKKIGNFSVWIVCTNGVVNPIIYSLRSTQFQTVLRKLLKCTM